MKPQAITILIALCMFSCTDKNNKKAPYVEEIPYQSIEDLEQLLVAHYYSIFGTDDEYMYNDEFVNLICNDTATLSYPFKMLKYHDIVSAVSSEDGRLRCYSWDNLSGGDCVSYSNIVQYRSGNKVYAHNASILDLIYGEKPEENVIGGDIRKIHTLRTGKLPIYLVYTFLPESTNSAYSDIHAIKILGDKIIPVNIFNQEEDPTSIGFEHSIETWDSTTNDGEGWDWLFRFDNDTQTLYVPIAEPELTDQYTLYQFDGKQMVNKGHSGGFWLHPSLRKFKRLFCLFETEQYRVRVDEMEDGTFRYSSWDLDQDMSEEPKIIIYNGSLDADEDMTCFENEKYRYIVDGEKLTILNPAGKTILQQSRLASE